MGTGSLENMFNKSTLKKLNENKVYSVLHFLETDAEKLAGIAGISVKVVFTIRQKLVANHSPNPLSWTFLSKSSSSILKTGVDRLDILLDGGLRCGSVTEICGLSGSGKTQLCLNIAVNVAQLGHNVLFCDTKGDFSPSHFVSLAKAKFSEEVIKTVKVVKPDNFYEFISILHSLNHCKLIILDSITVFSFPYIGSPVEGLRFLSHSLLMMKKFAVESNAVVILTNLTSLPFDQNEEVVEIKKVVEPLDLIPFMGKKYWQHAPHLRLVIYKDTTSIRSLWVAKSHSNKKGINCKLKLENCLFS